jgi:tRNA(Arg) A34 adenosine deaminase TadA
MQVQNTSCPFGPYAADIVNHHIRDPSNVHIDGYDCGVFIEGNTGERMVTKDPSKHAEIEATSRLLDCTLHPELCVLQGGKLVQTQANNRTFFGQLSMYTTGESCTMDAAMEVIAGYDEIIWGYPSDEHFRNGWPGTEVYSDTVYKKSNFKTMPTVVITHVQVDRYRPLYAWQYRADMPCPDGCMQVTSATSETGFTCTKVPGT